MISKLAYLFILVPYYEHKWQLCQTMLCLCIQCHICITYSLRGSWMWVLIFAAMSYIDQPLTKAQYVVGQSEVMW